MKVSTREFIRYIQVHAVEGVDLQFYPISQAASVRMQRVLFSLDIRWFNGESIPEYTDEPCLVIRAGQFLMYNTRTVEDERREPRVSTGNSGCEFVNVFDIDDVSERDLNTNDDGSL